MLSLDLTTTSLEFINWQAVTNALLKGEQVSVKQSGVEIGQFFPTATTQMPKQKRKLGFMLNEGAIPDDIHWGDDEIQAMFDDSINQELS